MASPMAAEGRPLNPREKAHFSLHISDRITHGEGSRGGYSSVRYNHKPSQTTPARTTTLTPASADDYNLTILDKDSSKTRDVFKFTGQKTIPKKSYILVFDPAAQKATLEPLDSTYTFNLATRNSKDVSSSHPKIYPRKPKDETSQDSQGQDDLFDAATTGDDDNDEPDPSNPYDFRHFLKSNKDKLGDESDFGSPDYRTGTGSARGTPLLAAKRDPVEPASSKPRSLASQGSAASKPRKAADPLVSRKPTTTKKAQQATPTVRLDRRASTHPKPAAAKATAKTSSKKKTTKASTAASSKIKSAELVHSSDEDSDLDAEGEPANSPPPSQSHSQSRLARSPSPIRQASSPSTHSHTDTHDADEDEDDEEDESGGGGGLQIISPDENPRQQRPRHNALASLGLGSNIGLGRLRSPSQGPVSLASVANSVEGSPNRGLNLTPKKNRGLPDADVIDFGSLGNEDSEEEEDADADAEGEEEDEEEEEERGVENGDVEVLNLGSPARPQLHEHEMQDEVQETVEGEEEEDPLAAALLAGFGEAGAESEESEEE